MNTHHATRLWALAPIALSLGLAFPAHAQRTESQLAKTLDDLTTQVEQLRTELRQLKEKQAQAAAAQASAPPVPAAVATAAPPSGPAAAPATQLSAYGEIIYSRPRRDSAATQTDVGRLVTGFQHRFDERTKVVAELEVEHAVASAGDEGEVAVEQVYIEHKLSDTFGARAGLFLMPIGLVNQSHEPTAYYGNRRPTVETAIIPSTLREAGLQVFGDHDNGISWSAGLSTSPDLSKWDPLDAESVDSPLRTVHQEGQLAKSKDLTVFGALDWRGLPGVRLGSGLMTGKMGHGTAGFAAPNARYTLWDLHANWTTGGWDLSALYARGTISGAGALNNTFGAGTFLVPKKFDGAYLQAAYKLRLNGNYTLSPFARLESVNTGRSFDGVAAPAYKTERIATMGMNFNITPTVVLKADIQRHKVVKDADSLNLGMGFSF